MISTMLWDYVAPFRLLLCVQGPGSIGDADWNPYCARIHELYRAERLRRILVYSDGEGPNAAQRKKLHAGIEQKFPLQTAVATHSVLARGIVTAIGWFTDIRAFSPENLDAAFEYLEIPRDDGEVVRRALATLRVQLTSAARAPGDMLETIGKLEELLTDRLPKLRERIARSSSDGRSPK